MSRPDAGDGAVKSKELDPHLPVANVDDPAGDHRWTRASKFAVRQELFFVHSSALSRLKLTPKRIPFFSR